ncbi:MAG: aspartate--tRNA ligase [Chloroflexota bacterium]|nr:aspartate--tRNA ligase [Chloroflexota bacterium]
MLKTHNCNELNQSHIDQTVTLAGWAHRRRDHGGLIFIDLRDREGIVQVVYNPQQSPTAHKIANGLRNEYVLCTTGTVAMRPSGTENPNLPTGDIEVLASEIEVLNSSKTPPFYINEATEVDENIRLKYRYLDLRRKRMKNNIILRHQVVKFMRDFLVDRGFLEIETPILINSTPEGARDYLVPSRIHPGEFYALPQSPQQIKQLLMVAGFEKYFQVAKCFRDEDLRADRQPEFTQLDIEMSFIDEEDILDLMEDMFTSLVETVKPSMRIIKPFPRLSFTETMERYGTDKPDIRFGLELGDVSAILAESEFTVFRNILEHGGKISGICIPGCAEYSRNQLNELTEMAKSYGAKGLVTMPLEKGPKGSISVASKSAVAKHLTPQQVKDISSKLGGKPGDLILLVADEANIVNKVLGQLRQEMGNRLGIIDPNLLAFTFIVDYPLLERNDEENRWEPMHHPFTAPKQEDIPLLDTDPGSVHSRHYDIVCNGYELSSGSIRIHQCELQQKIFELLGYTQQEIQHKFGPLLDAFTYGAPPHGGIAPGIDRVVMLLAQENNIREVIPFPKNQSAVDLLLEAPSTIDEAQLRELHLSLRDIPRT